MSEEDESRAQATERVTRLAFGWLWHKRKCRAIADEIGAPGVGLGQVSASAGIYRYDLVGVARCTGVESWRFDIVEVKGTRADLRREDVGAGKWARAREPSREYNFWLAVSDEIPREDYADLPLEWGVIRCSQTTVRIDRKPAGGGDIRCDAPRAARGLYVLSARVAGSRLPFMGRSPLDAAMAMVREEEKLQRMEQENVESQVQKTGS